jgi:hypothetical protein
VKKTYIFLIVLIAVIVLGISGFFIYQNNLSKETKEETTSSQSKQVSLDPKKEATHISKVAGVEGAYWIRGFDVVWNSIEPEKGKYSWEETDKMLAEFKGGQVEGAYHLSIIWPYANWDQETCHTGEKYLATGHLKRGGEDLYMGAPCDMTAYGEFIGKVVERYDGDGKNDMPDLKIPVKHWEIINEPSMQGGSLGGAGEDLKFFVGTSKEYFEILKTSYESIKKADSKAKVLHAGMAGMHNDFVEFWTPVFELGAGKYFDIANIHSISTNENTEDLFVIRFKRFLEKFGLEKKPIWVTEAQYGGLMEKPKNIPEFDKLMARSTVFALAKGADKIFLIENWTTWGDEAPIEPPEPDKDDKGDKEKGPPPKVDLTDSSTHKVYLNLLEKINSFDKIETLNEKFSENPSDYEGATSTVGHYKFTYGKNVVYVLWGEGSAVAPEISGKLKVTDIYGESKEIDAGSLKLSGSPIFVELMK